MPARLLLVVLALLLTACVGTPEGVRPVGNFSADQYLGRWYEIARLDHRFERGLSQVSAQYSRREDGGIKVVNRGFSTEQQEWQVAEGKAYFVEDTQTAFLKVSFFGPFYGSYIVMELDHADYRYALVSGPSLDYLWILAREPVLDQAILEQLLSKAEQSGFPVDKLIMVEQQ